MGVWLMISGCDETEGPGGLSMGEFGMELTGSDVTILSALAATTAKSGVAGHCTAGELYKGELLCNLSF